MAEEIDFENGRNSNFQGLVTLTMTLDPAIRHTVMHDASLIDIYLYTKFHSNRRNFLWTDGRTDIFPPILLGRLLEVDLKIPTFGFLKPTSTALSTVHVTECLTASAARLGYTMLPVL